MAHDDAVTEALLRLSTVPQGITIEEADFLLSLPRRGVCTPEQRTAVRLLVEKYLPPDGLAEELAGQARLPGLEGTS